MPRLSDRHSAIVLAVALFVSYAYFYQAGGWNQNSRFALVRAILERHTLQIDPYQEFTGDRALFQGHYYSDKAPGASLLALAPVAVARGIARAVGVNPRTQSGIAWTSYVAALATSGVFTLVASMLVMRLALMWGYSRGAALFAATAYGVASPAWCYATLFMEHGVTAGCLMLGFVAAVEFGNPGVGEVSDRCRTPLRHQGSDGGQTPLRPQMVGLWTGLAVVCQLQAAIPALFIVLLALAGVRGRRPGDLAGAAMKIVATGLVMGVVFFAYNLIAFGSPFHIGYASEEGFEQLRTVGFFGLSYPEWWRLREILVGQHRGLIPLAPLFALTPIGLALLARVEARRRAMLVAGGIAAYYFLWNASYFYWEGGWAYGPRHSTPALPFLALGLAPLWDHWKPWGRLALMSGWIWGAALTLVAVSTTPQPPDQVPSPVTELLWPAFRDGDLSLNNQSFTTLRARADLLRDHPELHAGWNLGEIAGLHGKMSLLPLGIVWALAGGMLLAGLSDPRPSYGSGPELQG